MANMLQLGTYFMIGDSGWEPRHNNHFRVQFSGLTNLRSVSGRLMPAKAADILSLSVASFTAPSMSITPIEVQFYNNSIKYAGKPSFDNASLVINDFIGADTEGILTAWFTLAYNMKTQESGLAIDYKKTGYLIESDGQGGNVRQWELKGCWPSTLNLGEWTYDGNAQRQFNCTIIYDAMAPKDW